jgi:hypothetical protein
MTGGPEAAAPDSPATRSSTRRAVLWGVVGLLSYLVLLQGYELWSGERVDLLVKAGTALAVGVVAALLSAAVGERLTAPTETDR